MCLVKLESLGELYGTEIFAVDKLTGEMYTVIDGTAKSINLQAYVEEEPEELEGAIGFVPKDTSTPKDIEAPGIAQSQSSKPSELSPIDEWTEASSILTCKDFRENRKKFKETLSISSVGATPQEIMKEDMDRVYQKNACSQRLTMVYRNQEIEKGMAHTDLEREAIDEFYEEYRNKYAGKLEGWQDVIDIYAEQELQKIGEKKQYKEQQYKQSREKKRQRALRVYDSSGFRTIKCHHYTSWHSKKSITKSAGWY